MAEAFGPAWKGGKPYSLSPPATALRGGKAIPRALGHTRPTQTASRRLADSLSCADFHSSCPSQLAIAFLLNQWACPWKSVPLRPAVTLLLLKLVQVRLGQWPLGTRRGA